MQEIAEKNERLRLKAIEDKDRYQRIGENDGVVYNRDGTREFWEGGIVGGVNDYIKVKSGHKNQNKHKLSHKNKFDGNGESFDEEFERKEMLKKIDAD